MQSTLALSRQLQLHDVDMPSETGTPSIADIVKVASRVITPLGPLTSFAARHPWEELEEQSFDQIARWLKGVQDVDLYPPMAMLENAKQRGEIDPKFLERGLNRWLESQALDLPRSIAEHFCRAALQFDSLSSSSVADPELKMLATKLSALKLPFEKNQPIQTVSILLQQHTNVELAHELDSYVIKWCKQFLKEAPSGWAMPNREKGFYHAWRQLAQYDPSLSHSHRQRLKNFPHEASAALNKALAVLEVPAEEVQGYLEAHLLSLPGWAGMMLWRSQQRPEEASLLIDYLAVRICLESALVQPYLPLPIQQTNEPLLLAPLIAAWAQWGDMPIGAWSQLPPAKQKIRLTLAYRFDDLVRRQLWLEAWEQTYEERLKETIASKQLVSTEKQPALAQFAFCIDTRSEPFRRALEQAGPFETFGVAGFFGLFIETCELGNEHGHPSVPVMFQPQHRVQEVSSEKDAAPYQRRRHTATSLESTFQNMKRNMLTSLLLPEVSGPWLSLQMLARSLFPRSAGRVIRHLRHKWQRKPQTKLSLDSVVTASELPIGFTAKEKVHYARQALEMMGLTKDFAPLVVICGHGSLSTNNPYAAALDCGACGGKSGGFNARVLATLCNDSAVRQALTHEGISIPHDTVFTAAEHITTLNELRWLYVSKLSDAAQTALDRVRDALPGVSHRVNEEQVSSLPRVGSRRKNPGTEVQRFAEDWSEVRPEWGLARNAAFIIGNRRLTKECNLNGRTFLHTYDWQTDHDGALLSNIISGPATVAQWINLQYYASTVAPHYYGSGNKVTQTVTAHFGVMQGNASDLLSGLPWQSVMKSDEEFYHAPLRLLVVIEAPYAHVKRLLDRHPVFRQKVQNAWIRLATIDPQGSWEIWS